MLKTWWRIIKTAVWLIGALLSFFVLIELLRAYQTLNAFHPIAGYVFVFVLAVVTITVFWYFLATLASNPPVLVPPKITEPEKATSHQLKRYAKYLKKYIDRLTYNQALSKEEIRKAFEAIKTLNKAIEKHDSQKLLEVVLETEENTIKPLLEKIDGRAKRQIRSSMRDVMIGVTLSPYKAADLLIVLYRNLVMVSRIIRVYNSRPRLRQQLQIFSDIVSVVATVNYINMGKNLIEGLGSHVPGIGTFIDDIAQGMGAGFMTTVVGHATMDRCKAFRGWNERQAKSTLKRKAATFYADVKDVFWVDIWPGVKTRTGIASAELKGKIASALDETGNAIGSFVKVPITAAVTAGSTVGKATTSSIKGMMKITRIFRRKKKPPK